MAPCWVGPCDSSNQGGIQITYGCWNCYPVSCGRVFANTIRYTKERKDKLLFSDQHFCISKSNFPMLSYRNSYSETGYDLSDTITHKLFVLVKIKFVSKIFSKVWRGTEVASVIHGVVACWGLARLSAHPALLTPRRRPVACLI